MSQLETRAYKDNSVNDLKIRLRNNLALRARNAADSADIDILKISATDVLEILRELSMTGNKITNLADPTNPLDAVNLQTLEAYASGIADPKDSVRLASDAAMPASTYANGASGVGATLTANANGVIPSIDGVAPAVGDRILLKNQASTLENGIYVVSDLGSGATPWILTRAEDAHIGGGDAGSGQEDNSVTQGMFTLAVEGSNNAGLGFLLQTQDPISLGTSPLVFQQFGEIAQAGLGLNKTGNTLSVDNGDGLGFSGNALVVLVDDDPVDGTSDIKAGNVVGRRTFKEEITLGAVDISNGYVDLAKVASRDSIELGVDCLPSQHETKDYTVNYTGGGSGKTRVTFAGDLASGGNAALIAGDVVRIRHESLDY